MVLISIMLLNPFIVISSCPIIINLEIHGEIVNILEPRSVNV